jgi:DNA-binding transcriptional ArsR family regulator
LFRKKEEDEIKRLREELEELKKQMKTLSEEPSEPEETEKVEEASEEDPLEIEEPELFDEPEPPEPPRPERTASRRRRIYYNSGRDFGDRLGDYIEGFVEDVMKGVSAELERSLFSDSFTRHRHRESRMESLDAQEAASVMSALGNEHRIRILEELSYGGAYSAGLQEALPDISASTLSSHLDVLEEAGLITQERRRGRYLITMPGRLAVKMAIQITDRVRRKFGER